MAAILSRGRWVKFPIKTSLSWARGSLPCHWGFRQVPHNQYRTICIYEACQCRLMKRGPDKSAADAGRWNWQVPLVAIMGTTVMVPYHKSPQLILKLGIGRFHMGQVMELRLSCYLVLLSAKPGNKTATVSWPYPSTDIQSSNEMPWLHRTERLSG